MVRWARKSGGNLNFHQSSCVVSAQSQRHEFDNLPLCDQTANKTWSMSAEIRLAIGWVLDSYDTLACERSSNAFAFTKDTP